MDISAGSTRLRRLLGICAGLLVLSASFPLAAAERQERGVGDILAVLDRPVDRERLAEARRVLEATPAADLSGGDLAEFHLARARAARELGLVRQEITALRECIDRGGGKEPYRAWLELGGAEFGGGNFRSGLEAMQRSLAMTPAKRRGFQLAVHAMLADALRRLGDFATAARHLRDAEGLLVALKGAREWNHYQYTWQAFVEDARGRTAFSAGRFDEAEARFRRTYELREKDLEQEAERRKSGIDATPRGNLEAHRDRAEAWLAQTLLQGGKVHEAEVRARRLAYRAIERHGLESLHANLMLRPLVDVLLEQRHTGDALRLVDRILANLDRLSVPPTAFPYVQFRRLRAGAYAAERRWREALVEFEALRGALQADPQLAEALGAPSLGWVRALIAEGRIDEARQESAALAAKLRRQMGDKAYRVAEAEGYHGAALAAAGREVEALAALRPALAILVAAGEGQDRSGARQARLAFLVQTYCRLLARIRGSEIERAAGIDAAAEAFLVADALQGRSVQQAMVASAARAAAGQPELADLARQEQDLRQERDALYRILAELLSRPAEQMLPAIVVEMQERAAALDLRHRSVQANLRERFPEYAELIAPRPATLAQVQSALRPGESLLAILPALDRTFIWAIPAQGEAAFAAVEVPRQTLDRRVADLRRTLDPQNGDLERLAPFDGAAAHRLYADLLLPVRAGWQGSRHLIVVAAGSLARLPFAVLTTAPPAPGDRDYRGWAWLAKEVAISQLPSAGALLTLRRMAPPAADRLPFAGFGDPDFRGDGRGAAPGTARRLRAVALPAELRDQRTWPVYQDIAPLPDTREEILALARTLGADPRRDVFLGAAASRKQVLEADLARRRVVAFATHGLLANELPGIDQPALALANPGDGGHGLLTLDDVLGLRLDADWVLLSACNTAAGDGEGAEALSGLGRAFFYAGGRALLATHWPVESVSARRLVVGVFEALAGEAGIGRAEALRRSMLALLADGGPAGAYGHPLYWAPYALIGDGGR